MSTGSRACGRSSRWHLDFWCRYVPRRVDGTFPSMQQREDGIPRSSLEALLARNDDVAFDYLADCLVMERAVEPDRAPAPAPATDDDRRQTVADAQEVEG